MSLNEIRLRWIRQSKKPSTQENVRIVIAATFTVEPLAPYLGVAYGESVGIYPAITVAPLNQLFQFCYNWKSDGNEPDVTAVVLLWRTEDLLRNELRSWLRGDTAALSRASDRLQDLAAAIACLTSSFSGVIAVGSPAYPHSSDHHVLALRSAREAGAFHRQITERWLQLLDSVPGICIIDIDAVQRNIGIRQSLDDRKLYLYHQPFTEQFLAELGAQIAHVIVTQKVAQKKCIVVDCDNTLWGGIIGEDGIEGISIGGGYPGNIFKEFQHQLLSLVSHGVLVAVCSKNDEAAVWEVFDNHDEMVLRRNHVSAFRINWCDKASNIFEIARELNVGVDSMVFVDDSALEIAQVRDALPGVTCIQVPSDLAGFPNLVSAMRLFDSSKITREDRARSEMMLHEVERTKLRAALDPSVFRNSLGLSVDVFEAKPRHLERIHQLVNKSNQFNTTTRRRTLLEIVGLCGKATGSLLAVKVNDRFGDYGLVGVVVAEFLADALLVDSLLLSCRVLGRGVEEALFAVIAEVALHHGLTCIRGEYIPSSKNAMVADLYSNFGFCEISKGVWQRTDLASLTWPNHILRHPIRKVAPLANLNPNT